MQFCESGARMRKRIMIPEDVSDGEIWDNVEEILERILKLPVTLSQKDLRTIRAVIEAKKRRLRKQPKTPPTAYRDADQRFW
jgi:hypothetical protein